MTSSDDIKKQFIVTDDSGFLAIVNSSAYKSFVSEDWQLNELFKHFVFEMNEGHILIWSTSVEGEWNILVSTARSSNEAVKEFTGEINVTDGKLCLINYEDLTMAAQVPTEKIPQEHNSDKIVYVDNGNYIVTVREIFNDRYNEKGNDNITNYEIVLTRMQTDRLAKNNFKNILWQE